MYNFNLISRIAGVRYVVENVANAAAWLEIKSAIKGAEHGRLSWDQAYAVAEKHGTAIATVAA